MLLHLGLASLEMVWSNHILKPNSALGGGSFKFRRFLIAWPTKLNAVSLCMIEIGEIFNYDGNQVHVSQ